jgi:four helix bundle protein
MAEPIRTYRDLVVWQKSIDLVVECYQESDGFPKSELYGLTNQLRRATVSIPSNVAEGKGRRSTRSYLHFLDISYGSLMEVETLIEIASRLKFLSPEKRAVLLDRTGEIGRMLNGLIVALEKKLGSDDPGGPPPRDLPLNPES